MQQRRIDRFTQNIVATISENNLSSYRSLLEKFISKSEVSSVDVAAALARMLDEGAEPLRLQQNRKMTQSGERRPYGLQKRITGKNRKWPKSSQY